MNRTIEYLFGTFSSLPILITSWFLSRFVPDYVCISLFIVCFIIVLFTKKKYNKNKIFFIVSFIILIFSSIHFFAFCITILDTTEYEDVFERKEAESLSWILFMPLSFIFSLAMGVLFDVWKNKFVTE
ncbi:MAG: hypothetical protein RBR78_09585 [Flavobacteriaceae bacterium]|jgi:hypothetical protein|nr:hypothetical protein [Flavobacteriaceae bacterium]